MKRCVKLTARDSDRASQVLLYAGDKFVHGYVAPELFDQRFGLVSRALDVVSHETVTHL